MTTIVCNALAKRPAMMADRKILTTMEISMGVSAYMPKLFRSICGRFAYGASGYGMNPRSRMTWEQILSESLQSKDSDGNLPKFRKEFFEAANTSLLVMDREDMYYISSGGSLSLINTYGFLGTGGRHAAMAWRYTEDIEIITHVVLSIDDMSGTDQPAFDVIYQDTLLPFIKEEKPEGEPKKCFS